MLAAIAAALDPHALPCCLGELRTIWGVIVCCPAAAVILAWSRLSKMSRTSRRKARPTSVSRAPCPGSRRKVRSQFFFDVADMPRDDGLIGVQPQRRPAEIRFFRCHYKVAKTAKVHSYRPRARGAIRGSRSGLRPERARPRAFFIRRSRRPVARRDKNTKVLGQQRLQVSALWRRETASRSTRRQRWSTVTFEVRRHRERGIRSPATR